MRTSMQFQLVMKFHVGCRDWQPPLVFRNETTEDLELGYFPESHPNDANDTAAAAVSIIARSMQAVEFDLRSLQDPGSKDHGRPEKEENSAFDMSAWGDEEDEDAFMEGMTQVRAGLRHISSKCFLADFHAG